MRLELVTLALKLARSVRSIMPNSMTMVLRSEREGNPKFLIGILGHYLYV